MKKQIIAEISEGLGNQLFMYAHAYALSKKINYELLIDDTSGYSKKKNKLRPHQKYMLKYFNVPNKIADNKYKFDNLFKYCLKQILITLDKYKNRKNFIFEEIKKINNNKFAIPYADFSQFNTSNNLFLKGNFENEKYFHSFRSDLLEIFKPQKQFLDINHSLVEKLKYFNSVSIHLRRHRYSDQINISNKQANFDKSDDFTNSIIDYVNKSISFFNKKISKPSYFIWSNDFKNIDKFLQKLNIDNYVLINENDVINDFYLFKFAKNFIVGPSSFHWWGAWLNENNDKICVRPSNLNPSNNPHFWPNKWIKI